uniref:Transcriptional regulator n=1 Tax=Parastrongyloides trichosuri TaxID=131310 RepID=A0A0N4Z691_PARTI
RLQVGPQLSQRGHAGVAGRHDHFGDTGGLGQLPCQGVFAAARADDKNLHPGGMAARVVPVKRPKGLADARSGQSGRPGGHGLQLRKRHIGHQIIVVAFLSGRQTVQRNAHPARSALPRRLDDQARNRARGVHIDPLDVPQINARRGDQIGVLELLDGQAQRCGACRRSGRWRHDLRRRLRLRGRGPAARSRQQSAAVDLGAELRPETHSGGTLRPCAAARRDLQGEPPRLGPRLSDAEGRQVGHRRRDLEGRGARPGRPARDGTGGDCRRQAHDLSGLIQISDRD